MYRVKVNSKNLVKSEELRAKGNLAYSKQKFETAMKLYNESLIFAPNNSNSYHVTIGNITAVLYEMARYEVNFSIFNQDDLKAFFHPWLCLWFIQYFTVPETALF